ncbi:MAG: hypothetical protein ABT00_02490 [Bordetella sp. SCN 68-11]|nr:MAG: hypothetical protein ABT00_02490 [Bordetella sp. SCN 68-11]
MPKPTPASARHSAANATSPGSPYGTSTASAARPTVVTTGPPRTRRTTASPVRPENISEASVQPPAMTAVR